MCQIQFIRKKGECLTRRDIAEFFKLMELGSLDNNCAFGFFNDKVFHKHEGRFHLGNFQKHAQLLNSQFIVGHNRLATTGHKDKTYNNHPFRLNDFTLVHNGTIDNYAELRANHNIQTSIETDSYVILWLINYYFEQSDGNRQQRICTAIQKTAQKLSGSFSVLLHDRGTDDLYYFKNRLTSFAFCLFDDAVLIGSTNPVNLEHVYLNDR